MTTTGAQAEQAVLGAALLSREARDLAVDRLTAEAFHDPRHGHLFHALTVLAADGAPSDPVTAAAALEKQGLLETVGGLDFLAALIEAAPTRDRASVERWATVIEEAHALRALGHAAAEISDLATTGGDAAAAIDQAEKLLAGIHRPSDTALLTTAGLVAEQHTRLERVRSGELDEGIPTGIPDLDGVLGGLVEDRFYLIAARPSMGKTGLGHHLAMSVAVDHKRPVLIVSLEMRGAEVVQRLTCSRGRIAAGHLDDGHLTPDESRRFEAVSDDLAAAPVFVIDAADITVQSIRSAARKIKATHGDLGAIVIDYLQLMSGNSGRRNESRQQEVSDISRGCKVMARDLQVPVVGLSQLNRGLEQRQDKRPVIADLRESGALEQDADAIVFIYRDEHYNPATDDPGIAELIVAKNRQGPSGVTVRTRWVPEWVAFVPLDDPGGPTNRTPAGIPEEF